MISDVMSISDLVAQEYTLQRSGDGLHVIFSSDLKGVLLWGQELL